MGDGQAAAPTIVVVFFVVRYFISYSDSRRLVVDNEGWAGETPATRGGARDTRTLRQSDKPTDTGTGEPTDMKMTDGGLTKERSEKTTSEKTIASSAVRTKADSYTRLLLAQSVLWLVFRLKELLVGHQ